MYGSTKADFLRLNTCLFNSQNSPALGSELILEMCHTKKYNNGLCSFQDKIKINVKLLNLYGRHAKYDEDQSQ